jgi:molecular chaperone DnaK (HSP70)
VQQLTLDLVRRTFAMCDEVLAQASLKARDIEAVFLAGGSTRLPGLRGYIESYFGRRPRVDLDPMEVVSMGASLAAARPAVSELLDPCA